MASVEEKERAAAGTTPARRSAWALSVSAVAVAAIALAVVLVVPRFAVPANVIAQHATGGALTIGPSCTYYSGAEVTINVPRAGMIVVSATVGIGIGHEFGTSDEARVVVTDRSLDCPLDEYTAFVSVPATLPTDRFHFETVPIIRSFVVAEGSHTYYVNGIMVQGYDVLDRFDSASMVAVFYAS